MDRSLDSPGQLCRWGKPQEGTDVGSQEAISIQPGVLGATLSAQVTPKGGVKQKIPPLLVWPSGMGAVLQNRRSPVPLLVGARAWAMGSVPDWGRTRGNPINVSLPFSPAL